RTGLRTSSAGQASWPTPTRVTSTTRRSRRPRRCSARSSSPAASRIGHKHMRVLVIDNYDSFTYNLVQYLGELGAEPDVVRHDVRSIFRGVENPLVAGRYHSLVVDSQLPPEFELSAEGGGAVMAIRHRELPAEGVQFHPESVLTESGKLILQNFLDLDR